MLVLKEAGYEVVSVYLTKGEAGIVGKSHAESAAIRVEEATCASQMLGARPVFMTQIDGNTEINKERYVEMRELIAAEKPDVVFTHWPIDSHADHRVCSLLVYDAWRRLGYNFELYYFEVMSGMQTTLFHPTDYVDISKVPTASARHAIATRVRTWTVCMIGTARWNASAAWSSIASVQRRSSICGGLTVICWGEVFRGN